MKTKLILLIIALALFGAGFKSCKKSSVSDEPLLTVYNNTQERTERGILIASVTAVSAEFKQAADESLETLFADARALGYANNLDFGLYTIYVLPDCQLTPESRTRGFLIRADAYDGTIYDQDPRPGHGKVFAAEMVINNGNDLTNSYVVCDTPVVDQELRNAVRYGAEHIILKRNDESAFAATAIHNGANGHPIIRSASALRLAAPSSEADAMRQPDFVDYAGQVKIRKK